MLPPIPDTVGLLDLLPLGALETRHAGPRISGWRAIIDRDRELCTKAADRRPLRRAHDARGAIEDFVTSGLPPEERRQMIEWPDGARLFAHLRDQPTPLRVADLPGYL